MIFITVIATTLFSGLTAAPAISGYGHGGGHGKHEIIHGGHGIGHGGVIHSGGHGGVVHHGGGGYGDDHHGGGGYGDDHHGGGGYGNDHHGGKHHGGGYQHAPKKYDFGYGVKDSYHGTNFGHSESGDGYNVKGSYYVNLPDGRLQKVSYYTDKWGYHPTITYEGKAHFPVHKKGYGHEHHDDHSGGYH